MIDKIQILYYTYFASIEMSNSKFLAVLHPAPPPTHTHTHTHMHMHTHTPARYTSLRIAITVTDKS
jgi:uncharacterized membrane protein YcgQ (UPF0703/DUF1980 family)